MTILISISCTNPKDSCLRGEDDKPYAILESIVKNENESFLERILYMRQFGNRVVNKSELKWLRKPSNLSLFYGTVKSIGLENFINKTEFTKPLFTDQWAETEWANKSLHQIVDNLINEFQSNDSINDYYCEFWKRRTIEKNEKETYAILKDIRNYYNGEKTNVFQERNDTLRTLLSYESRQINKDYSDYSVFIKEYAEDLILFELPASAYNLIKIGYEENVISESTFYEITSRIATDTVECDTYWNWRESAIWNNEIYDYYH